MSSWRYSVSVACLGLLTIRSHQAWAAAEVPSTLNHQGRLFDAQMVPATGQHTLTFKIYDAAIGGTSLWAESQTLSFEDGNYATSIGTVVPFGAGVWTATPRYLGITVDNDPEMIPRQPILSVPFAIRADNAIGDITPRTVNVGGKRVIDASGRWVGPAETQQVVARARSMNVAPGTAQHFAVACATDEFFVGGLCDPGGSQGGPPAEILLVTNQFGGNANNTALPAPGVDGISGIPRAMSCAFFNPTSRALTGWANVYCLQRIPPP